MSASTPLTPAAAKRKAAGKRLRDKVPLAAQSVWHPAQRTIDPIQVLLDQDKDRLQALVPVRHSRMDASAFAFYRGSAAVMACDLATTPSTGIMVQANGDAHLSNYGLFATPERRLVFDMNDFDETLPGPWEWDVKRLATSFVLAARGNKWKDPSGARLAETAVNAYRTYLRGFAGRSVIDVWYASAPVDQIRAQAPTEADREALDRVVATAEQKTSAAAVEDLTEVVGKKRQFKLILDEKKGKIVVPLRDLAMDKDELKREIHQNLHDYRHSISVDRRHLLSHFEIRDIALKVVGVGSVGTRCFAVLCEGIDHGEPLMLQVKQAMDPALALAGLPSKYTDQGHRVVDGQRMIQAASDVFLGYSTNVNDQFYYWRQLADEKGSVDITKLDRSEAKAYAMLCGWALAHAHARSGDSVAIAGYLGKSADFEKAIRKFAVSYADQAEQDHAAWHRAVQKGKISSSSGTLTGIVA